jgi:hypothetical protein
MSAPVDPRLVFLARASARLILVEASEMDLDQAFDGLFVESPCAICDCRWRWVENLVERWERTHPPLKHRGRR